MAHETLLPDIPINAIEDATEQYRALESLRVRLEEILQVLIGDTAAADTSIEGLLTSTGLSETGIVARLDAIDTQLATLLGHTDITDIANTAATVSGAYVQAEVQLIADDVKIVSDKYDELLAILRTAGILV